MEKPTMNLYLLQRTNQYAGCDETIAAIEAAGDEGGSLWVAGVESKYGIRFAVTCELLTADGEAGVVCRDYQEG